MPPSLAPLKISKMNTGDKNFYAIEQVYNHQLINKIAGDENTASQVSSASIVENAGILQTDATYRFEIYTAGNIPVNGYFTFKIPDAIRLPEEFASDLIFKCEQGCSLDKGVTVQFNQGERIVSFKGLFYDAEQYLTAPGPLIFTIKGWINPHTNDKTFIEWSSYNQLDGQSYLIDRIKSMYIQPSRGQCTLSQFESSSYQIYDIAQKWEVKLSCPHSIIPSNTIQLTFPPDFYVIESNNCKVGGANPNPGYTCIANTEKGTISFKNFYRSEIQANTELSFYVEKAVRNPPLPLTNLEVEVAVVATVQGVEAIIDSVNYVLNQNVFEKGKVLEFAVNAQDGGVGAFPVKYDFKIKPSGDIQQGSYLVIQVAPEVSIYDTLALERECGQVSQGFTSQVKCLVDENQIKIVDGFQLEGTNTMVGSTLESINPPELTFTLGQFLNPLLMTLSSPYGLTIYGADDQVNYQWVPTTRPTINGVFTNSVEQGPLIQMTRAQQPESLQIKRDSYRNGEITTYEFTVKPKNPVSDNDIIVISFPEQIELQPTAVVQGASPNLKQTLESKQRGQNVIQFTVAVQERRRLASILSPDSFTFKITEVKNPVSTRRTSSLTYQVKDSIGNILEEQTEGLEISNTLAGNFVSDSSSVIPTDFDGSSINRYTFVFEPTNFEQDMYVIIKSPPQIPLGVAGQVTCFGEQGTDSQQLECEFEQLTGEIKITQAFTFQNTKPPLVKIGIDSFKNPQKGTVTGSFKIATFTHDGFKLDMQDKDLTVNFFCEFPCQTCDQAVMDKCFSCFKSGNTHQNWFDFDCYTECPAGYTASNTNNCTACAEPCATCTNTTSTCSSCIKGYRLYKENQCVEDVYYPFPWLIFATFWFIVVACSECATKGVSKFKEAFIAMLSLSELGSWVTFCVFVYFRQGFSLVTIGALAAVGTLFILNFAHAITHCKSMVPNAPTNYQKIMVKYKCCSGLIRALSYTLSFKFSMILISYFYMKRHLKGDYSQMQEWQFNLFSLLFIMISLPLMMASAIYYLISDTIFSYPGFIAIEVIVVSLALASLMLADAISVFKCKKGRPKKLKVFAAPAVDMDFDSQDEGQRIKKRMGKGNNNFEFGEFDYEDSKPNTTNQTILYDEFKDVIKKMNEDKSKFEQQQKEMADLIRQLIAQGLSKEEVIKIVDAKIGQSDELNQAILREMYEDQLAQLKQQALKGYKDFEAEMDNDLPLTYRTEEKVKNMCQLPEAVREQADSKPKYKVTDDDTKEMSGDEMKVVLPTPKTSEVQLIHEGDQVITVNKAKSGQYGVYEKSQLNLDESAVWQLTASYNSIPRTSMHDQHEYLQATQAQMEKLSHRCKSRDFVSERFFIDEPAIYGKVPLDFEGEYNEVQNQACFESVGDVRNASGSEKEYLASEYPNMRTSEEQFKLYELQGQEMPQTSARGPTLEQDPSQKPMTKPKKPSPKFKQEQAVGLQLVDLGLGKQFEGKGQIKKNAVEWYLKKEQRSPLNNSNKSSPARASGGKGSPGALQKVSSSKKNTPKEQRKLRVIQDEYGHSESSEGIVNHEVFTAQHYRKVEDVHPTEATRKLVKFNEKLPATRDNSPSHEEQIKPHATSVETTVRTQPFQQSAMLPPHNQNQKQKKQKKDILYSDRSESPVDDLMDDTPSNYNLLNGRLEGKSTGIKAMQSQPSLSRQNKIDLRGAMPNSFESREETGQWSAMHYPFGQKASVQTIYPEAEIIEENQPYVKSKKQKKNIKTLKQFAENGDGSSRQPLAYMGGKEPQKNNYF